MKNPILIVLLLVLSLKAFPQEDSLPYFPLRTDTIEQIINHKYLQVLADAENMFTIEEIRSPRFDSQFKYLSDLIPIDSGSSKTYWIRFRVKNETNNILRVSLVTGASKANFYLEDSLKNISYYKTGFGYSFRERDGSKSSLSIPIQLYPGTVTTIYYNRQSNEIQPGILKGLEVTLASTVQIIADELRHYETRYYSGYYFLKGAVFGLLVLAACFNFFFFLTVRERVYLYLCLFLLTYSLSDNFFLSDVLFSGSTLANTILDSSIALCFIFLLQFVRHFYKTFQFSPRWDMVLRVSLFLQVIQYILFFLPIGDWGEIDWELFIEAAPIVLCVVLLAITMVLMFKRSEIESKFFLLAIAPVIVCLLIFLTIAITGELDSDEDSVLAQLALWVEDWGDSTLSVTICWAVVVFSWTLFSRYNKQRKEIAAHLLENERLAKEKEIERNQLIAQQKVQLEKEVEERTTELKQSLQELKSTQSQLIQSEKMASLGELTAGIAHEIQNPLNFVNNFSEVSNELIAEMKAELATGNRDLATEIANDLKQNLEKINHHGKRAADIVKGMLQHSRTSTGQKELTDINALCDEYLRLSYHGLRAKDKSFHAKFETSFDLEMPKVNVVPQEMGRVILNLINNAFYAVNEKSKRLPEKYEPTVTVSTKKESNNLIITVADNGDGIPAAIKDKIFQPFFTTKPTGQGTGLGLSLSYDIITKGHGGELHLISRENTSTEFVIRLPIV